MYICLLTQSTPANMLPREWANVCPNMQATCMHVPAHVNEHSCQGSPAHANLMQTCTCTCASTPIVGVLGPSVMPRPLETFCVVTSSRTNLGPNGTPALGAMPQVLNMSKLPSGRTPGA